MDSLEVDQRDANGMIYNGRPEEKIQNEGQPTAAPDTHTQTGSQESVQKNGEVCRLKRRTVYLFVALTGALIAAIVAAVVGGVIAARRQSTIAEYVSPYLPNSPSTCMLNKNNSLRNQLEQAPTSPPTLGTPTSSNSTCPSGATSTPEFRDSPFNSATVTTLPSALRPVSSCRRLAAGSVIYTVPYSTLFFEVHCNGAFTSYQYGPDIMGIYLYTFEDCINACAKYNDLPRWHLNSTCYAVTYYSEPEEGANCWLKGSGEIPLVARVDFDSAALVQGRR